MSRRLCGPLSGPLLSYGAGFEATLIEQGYSAASVKRHLRLMVHLSRWLDARNLAATDLTVTRAGEFLRGRRAEGPSIPFRLPGWCRCSISCAASVRPQRSSPRLWPGRSTR